MNVSSFKLNRDATIKQWRALPHDFKKGDVIYVCMKCDYGCASDDYRFGGVDSISCTESPEGDYPFFTVPREWLDVQK